MSSSPLQLFFEKYVQGTAEKAPIVMERQFICTVLKPVSNILCNTNVFNVSISTRALKHMYDKKPAEEFDCLLKAVVGIIQFPLRVYKDKNNKRGNYCFSGMYKNFEYIFAIELIEGEGQIVTGFRKRDDKYLKEYILLWSREVDSPSIAHL